MSHKPMRAVPMEAAFADMTRRMILANTTHVPDTGCWLWMRSLNAQNYGQVTFRPWRSDKCRSPSTPFGESWAPKPAHRVSLSAFQGRYLVGGAVDHLCRHPWCVNPDHLEWVTQRENVLRGLRVRGYEC